MTVSLFSGGACSFLATHRYIQDTGVRPVLLFSDTGVEDEDLYRFVADAVMFLECPLVTVTAGETFDAMIERNHALPSDRMPFCSRELKVAPAERWLREHVEVGTLIVGLDWTETHRLPKVERRYPNHTVVAPMMGAPYLMKGAMVAEIESLGLVPPRLYGLGFSHNNCGGGCVRNGHRDWQRLHDELPDRFQEWAKREALIPGYSFSRDRRGGESKPYTLAQMAKDWEAGRTPSLLDQGGCGCFVDSEGESKG